MKMVAFMQSPNHPEGTVQRIIDMYRDDQAFHKKLLATSMSGARLRVAFGNHWFDQIWWDNVSPRSDATVPDVGHVEQVIMTQVPDLILTFGRLAAEGISQSIAAMTIKVMTCHHPNARHRTQSDLDQFAQEVIQYAIHHDRANERE